MGEKRREGSGGSVARGRNGTGGRRTPANFRPRYGTGGEKRPSPGARVVPLPASRRARRTGAGRLERGTVGSSTGNASCTVGYRRLRMVLVVFVLTALLLGGRAVQMSLTNTEQYQAFAAEQGAGESAQAGQTRGCIVSADGRKLATSLAAARVIATPYLIGEPAQAARSLADLLGPETGQDASEIEALLTERNADGELSGYSVVASGIRTQTAQKVAALGIEGISTAPDDLRVYPEGALASQLMGHVGDYGEVFGGVEARYDGRLEARENVTLTVDTAVQQELEKAIAAAVEKSRAKSAVGLVMRIDDGAVVALANVPGYNNNRFSEAPVEAQRNRILTDPYEPGSTFKAFTVAAALEEGAITDSTTFSVPDRTWVADRLIHDSQPHGTMVLTPGGVLRESSNVGAIQVAQALGGPKLYEYIRRFGFGEATGVDLWGEDPGSVPAYEEWSGSSIGNIPIGQGLMVTPLQLASGYATIANGGRAVTPHVTEAPTVATPGPRVISEETSAIVRGMLQGVVDEGSGHHAQIPGYTVAGKTGTSQKVDPETGTYGDEYVASFIGFAPVSDPEYLVLVAVDEPETSYWGEVVAIPAFHEVMSFTLGYFNVPPDRVTHAATGTNR